MANFSLELVVASYRAMCGKESAGCQNWTGSINHAGYGVIRRKTKAMLAHRVSWLLHKGEISDGKYVLHKCDNRRCTNPDHLFLGSIQDNVRDMVDKGRQRGGNSRGEQHGLSKLTQADVLEIRRLAGANSSIAIGRSFNVSSTTVLDILHRRTWRNVV